MCYDGRRGPKYATACELCQEIHERNIDWILENTHTRCETLAKEKLPVLFTFGSEERCRH